MRLVTSYHVLSLVFVRLSFWKCSVWGRSSLFFIFIYYYYYYYFLWYLNPGLFFFWVCPFELHQLASSIVHLLNHVEPSSLRDTMQAMKFARSWNYYFQWSGVFPFSQSSFLPLSFSALFPRFSHGFSPSRRHNVRSSAFVRCSFRLRLRQRHLRRSYQWLPPLPFSSPFRCFNQGHRRQQRRLSPGCRKGLHFSFSFPFH